MKRCATCLLPETFPNTHFDTDGICNYCRDYQTKGEKIGLVEKEKARRELDRIFERSRNKGPYDCLVGLSGGKDSSLLLYTLKEEYKLRVLAFTGDSGFLSEAARVNVDNVVGKLGVDHIYFRPRLDLFKKFITYFLTDGDAVTSRICPVCSSFYGNVAKMIAVKFKIPLVAFGWSPEQAESSFTWYRRLYEVGRARFYSDSWVGNSLFHHVFDEEDRRYFWELYAPQVRKFVPRRLARSVARWCPRRLFKFAMSRYPLVVTPYKVWKYDPEANKRKVVDLGLIEKGRENPLKTNCRLIHLMYYVDYKRFGYNPFIAEYATYVREGKLSRDEWLKSFGQIEAQIESDTYAKETINSLLETLGLTRDALFAKE